MVLDSHDQLTGELLQLQRELMKKMEMDILLIQPTFKVITSVKQCFNHLE